MSAGRVIGLARRAVRRAPMEELAAGDITAAAGLAGDFKGAKHPTRQITILAREDWQDALAELPPDAACLHWTTRRANLFCEGLRLPRAAGAVLAIGDVTLEVTGQTHPCKRMDEAFPGLLKALAPDWRGGVTCKVVRGGTVQIGDPVRLVASPPETVRKLPG